MNAEQQQPKPLIVQSTGLEAAAKIDPKEVSTAHRRQVELVQPSIADSFGSSKQPATTSSSSSSSSAAAVGTVVEGHLNSLDRSDTRGLSTVLAATERQTGGRTKPGEEWLSENRKGGEEEEETRSRFEKSNDHQRASANQLNHLSGGCAAETATTNSHCINTDQRWQQQQQQVEQTDINESATAAAGTTTKTTRSQVATEINDNHHDRSTNNANANSCQINSLICSDSNSSSTGGGGSCSGPQGENQPGLAQIQSQPQDYRAAAAGEVNEQETSSEFDQAEPGSLYWKLLSNLPTSITQRGRLPTGLAPEVAGYLAAKRRDQQLKCNSMSLTNNNSNSNKRATTESDESMDSRPPPYDGCGQQQQQEMIMMSSYTAASATAPPPTASSRVIRIVAPPYQDTSRQQQQQQDQTTQHQQSSSSTAIAKLDRLTEAIEQQRPQHLQANKLSIASSRTTTRSSATSLSSCILSESSSSSVVRLKWGKKMDFLLSIIGFAVDLANIWRFPYLVYKNGGGVFLIPYVIMLIFGGIPLFFLELCLGQFVKKGPITVWNKICPSMKGVGYCSIMISWYVSFYYNVLIAWSVYFIYRSLSSINHKMPWEDCDNAWNSNGTCVSISRLKELCSHQPELTLEACRKQLFNTVNVTSPASEFFVKELSQIDQSTGLDDMGNLRWELVLCTMVVYLLHYFSLFRGLETSGKVVWVTATAPYMILSILLVRGLFLPGAAMGIEYYLSPRLEKLADPQVWIDAAGQVFYSIGVGFGVHLTYASFNSHNNNCYRDCLMTSAVNALTSVYSGLVVFVYLGYMAKNLGIEIDKVASEGYSLVFEVYPEALTTLPFARFWSILFFIMLLTLGIDSAMGGLEAVITGLEDEFKFARRLSRGQLTGLVIVSSFLPALISCTQGGAYTLFWFDIYSAGVSLLFSALFETIGVVYCYGLSKFIPNIESMLGRKPPLFYILCWKYISPIFLCGVIFMSIYTAGVPTYRGYTFPLWSIILGWCLAFSSVAAVPAVAIWYWCNKWCFGSSLDKSGRKRDRGSSSVASSRHGSSKKSPSHRSVSVSCGLQPQGGGHTNTTTSVLATSPIIDSKANDKYPDCIEDML